MADDGIDINIFVYLGEEQEVPDDVTSGSLVSLFAGIFTAVAAVWCAIGGLVDVYLGL